MENKQTFYLTFGIAHPLSDYYVVIKCKDHAEAWNIAKIQFSRYAEIYSQKEWAKFVEKYGETYDVHFGKKLAAVIDNYRYTDYYLQEGVGE